ncbi:DUF711 domain-containing protein, partial [Candidatus Poribacteria bacterium]
MKIRTITTGIPSPFSHDYLQRAAEFNATCRTRFEANGYEVQSTRISTQVWNDAPDIEDILALETQTKALGIEFLSLGTIFPDEPHPVGALSTRAIPPNPLEHIADAIAQSETFFASVSIDIKDVNDLLIGRRVSKFLESTANIIQQIAHNTENGYGNLRFAALMNCPPNTPFFPAAYWQADSMNFGIGWQAADLVYETFADAPNLNTALQYLKTRMEKEGQQIVAIAQTLAHEHEIPFVGIDVSPAPMGDESIAYALEQQLPGHFGERGTLTVCANLTRTLRALKLPLCGYSGLMLPVLEDIGLGQRSQEGCFNLDSLLLYSAVCGTGLDTIPIPGDATTSQITAILTDVATLSSRLSKPLS